VGRKQYKGVGDIHINRGRGEERGGEERRGEGR
jgi:hypothetical protein